jgi:carbamoyl-phosphate synthase large subunit
MEHIEEAGIHSGDSSCVMPPHSLCPEIVDRIKEISGQISLALGVVGFINIQFAVQGEEIFVIEANPRASRTIPFVSKATGVPWAAIGTRVIVGESLSSLAHLYQKVAQCVAVKSVVMPFNKFPDAQVKLGPEMRSTGEVMGIAYDFLNAYGKAQAAADRELRTCQKVWLSGSPCFSSDIAVMSEKIAAAGLSAVISNTLSQNVFTPEAIFLPVDSIASVKALLSASKTGLVVSLGLIDEGNPVEQLLRRAAIELNVPLIMSRADAHMAVQFMADKSAHKFFPVALQELSYADQVSLSIPELELSYPDSLPRWAPAGEGSTGDEALIVEDQGHIP